MKDLLEERAIATSVIVTDFEKAMMNAVERVFSETLGIEAQGCYFHLRQNMMESLGQHGLKVRYGESVIAQLVEQS